MSFLIALNTISMGFLVSLRGWSLCEIMDQVGAGFHKPGQQQRLLFPVEAGQDYYIKEICSPGG